MFFLYWYNFSLVGEMKMWSPQSNNNIFNALSARAASPSHQNARLGFNFMMAAGGNHTIITTRGDAVFVCGSNQSGQLGLGLGRDENRNVPIKIPEGRFGGEKIIAVTAGMFSSFFVTAGGRVFVCGSNDHGQLGLRNDEDRDVPTKISEEIFGGEKIIAVAAGCSHSIFVMQSGRVFVCGSNDHGQLGLGLGRDEDRNVPRIISEEIFGGEKIIAVAACMYSSFFVTAGGRVFVCGENDDGQLGLGLGRDEDRDVPTKIPEGIFGGEKIIAVAAGLCHSIFVMQSGRVFVCGYNASDELGLKDLLERRVPAEIPREKFNNDDIVSATAGYNHTIFQTHNNYFYSCGLNNQGQLGRRDVHWSEGKPLQVMEFFNKPSNVIGVREVDLPLIEDIEI